MRRRLVPWLPELALLALGIVLRATMVSRFDPAHGYDFRAHWKYLEWLRTHWGALPDAGFSRATYHPPLYYYAVTALRRAGLPDARMGTLSVIAGRVGLARVDVAAVTPSPPSRLARRPAVA